MELALELQQPRANFDTPWKNILEVYFQSFVEMCHPIAAKNIDWSRGYVSLDKELNAITKGSATKNRIADKVGPVKQ